MIEKITPEEKEVFVLLRDLILRAGMESLQLQASKYPRKSVDQIPFKSTEAYTKLIQLQKEFCQGQISCSEARRIATRYAGLLVQKEKELSRA